MTTRTTQHLGTIFREATIIRAVTDEGADNDIFFDVCYSTGAAVRRWDWEVGPFFEELSIDPAHIKRDRLDAGIVPVLLDHIPTVRNTVGIVVKDWVENGKAYARLRMEHGTPDADAILNKLRQGIIKTVSVGYRVYAFLERKSDNDKIPTLTAIEWEPWEISFTPVPADAGAKLRSDGDPTSAYPCEIQLFRNSKGEFSMPDLITTVDNPAPIETRAAPAPATTQPVDVAAAIAKALESERVRSAAIRARGQQHNIDGALVERMVAEGRTEQEASVAFLEALAARQAANPTNTTIRVGHSYDDPNVIRSAIESAYAFKIAPSAARPEGKAQEFIGRSFLDSYAELLESRGERVPHDREQLATRAMATTSDFPIILGNATHQVVSRGYEASPQTYQQLAQRMQFSDFRPHYMLRSGEFPALEPLGEGGEIKSKSLDDGKQEMAQIDTKAIMIGIGRNLVINDNLGMIGMTLATYGRRIAEQENKAFWDYVKSNPKLYSDNTAVFHANHKNLFASPVASPDVDSLSTLRAMLRKFATDGIPHNFPLETLFIDPDLETEADKLRAAIFAAQTGEVNPFSGRFNAIVEPNLESHNAWYGGTSPSRASTFVWGDLNGNSTPMVDTKEGWSRLGFELRIIRDWGVGVNGSIGLIKVPKS